MPLPYLLIPADDFRIAMSYRLGAVSPLAPLRPSFPPAPPSCHRCEIGRTVPIAAGQHGVLDGAEAQIDGGGVRRPPLSLVVRAQSSKIVNSAR